MRSKSPLKGPLRYGRPGVLRADPARRNASAIASPLMDPGLLWPGRISAGRRRFSDPVARLSARAVAGHASKASSSRALSTRPTAFWADLQHLDTNNIAGLRNCAWVLDPHVNKGAERGDIRHETFENHAGLQILELFPLPRLR